MSEESRFQSLRLEPVAGPTIDPVIPEPGGRTFFGRGTDCDVCLADANVSRRHAAVDHQGDQWLLTDLGSRHGTFLNGVRLEPRKPTLAGDGDLLRLGSFVFRVRVGGGVGAVGGEGHTLALTDGSVEPGEMVESVSARDLDVLAHRRLSLMIEGSAAVYEAQTEGELARAVVELSMSGTGFGRAALLRFDGSPDRVEVLAIEDCEGETSEGFVFSQSLLRACANGELAKLTRSTGKDYGQSIVGLGILSALCAPLIVDSAVIGAIYLDSRAGEVSPQPDAASFCHAVSQIASIALSSLKRVELVQRQGRLDEDLKIAQEAQTFLLPASTGTVGPLGYASRTCAGSVVGGDLFDIFKIDEQKTGICFGDITGHGIGAAILMTAVLSHLRATLTNCGDPVAAVTEVNAYLVEHSSDRMFATLWVGVFDAATNVLSFVDAGHGHWLISKVDAEVFCPPSPGGLMIGITPEFEYSSEEIDLKIGDRLVLYSDGIVEQPNMENDRFENARLREVIAKSGSIGEDVSGVFRALGEFMGEGSFADDTTIASIEIGGEGC